MPSRRDVLKRLGAFAGAAAVAPHVLTGCDDPAEAGITNIVVVCMENRSYDHYLGSRAFDGKPGDGLATSMTNARIDGSEVAVYHSDAPCVSDPPHNWDRAHAQWNGGAMDGFLREYEDADGVGIAPHVMGYFTGQELPTVHALADAYTVCDRWFASILGPTWPNRMFLYAGDSDGLKTHVRAEVDAVRLDTVLHRLTARGVPWRYYFTDVPFTALLHGLDPANNKPVNFDFFRDAERGELPPVCYVDPGFGFNDDHPPRHPILGQQFLAGVYTALANSPQWKNLLLVVMWDENGGFYDHVAPPTIADARADQGFGQLGFRVPALVIGPYVKQSYLSSVVYNHASVVRHIEKMFGLDPITARVADSADLTDAIDLVRLAEGKWRPAPAIPPVVIDQSQLTEQCQGSFLKYAHPTDIELLADTGYFGALDRRRYRMDDVHAIASVLERHGAGRLRKGW